MKSKCPRKVGKNSVNHNIPRTQFSDVFAASVLWMKMGSVVAGQERCSVWLDLPVAKLCICINSCSYVMQSLSPSKYAWPEASQYSTLALISEAHYPICFLVMQVH